MTAMFYLSEINLTELKYMKSSTLLNSFLYFVFALVCVSSIGCGPNFGEKIEVDGTEIFYKGGVTQADAQRLGDKLKAMEFVDGNRKSVQLLKRDDAWEFRMAVSKSGDSETIRKQMKHYCLELSSAFGGDPVEVHICNSKLESKSIVKGLSGKRYQYGNSKAIYFYEGVDVEKVKGIASVTIGAQLDTGAGNVFHISKSADAIEIRMAHSIEAQKNKNVMVAATTAAVSASNTEFGGKRVDVLICDQYFDSPKVFSSVKNAGATAP